MKRIFLTVAAAALVLVAAVFSFGQNISGATAAIESVPYQIANQPGCPLQIGIHERLAARVTSAPLKFTNNDSAAVRAFVVHVSNGARHNYNQLVFLGHKGLATSETRLQSVPVRARADDGGTSVISVDYVQFADGRTWGADSLGRSKDVTSWLAGYDLAVSRLKNLIGDQDDTDFMKAVGIFGTSGFGSPVSLSSRIDFFAKGYQGVINRLRWMKKNVDDAKKFARDLELMENDLSR